MGRQDWIQRMEGNLGLRKKIDRLNASRGRVLEYALPGALRQDSAVTRTRVILDKPLVREEEERLVLSVPNVGPPSPK